MDDKWLLSILICGVPQRLEKLQALYDELNYEIGSQPIEVVALIDNLRMRVGEKRNRLLSLARGQWVTFLDDDDRWHEGAVRRIVDTINGNQDKKVICIRGTRSNGGSPDLPDHFSRKFGMNHRSTDANGNKIRGMIPNHLCIWKKSVAILEKFPEINLTEDHRWAKEMLKHYTEAEQAFIDDYIYHYDFNRATSLTRK